MWQGERKEQYGQPKAKSLANQKQRQVCQALPTIALIPRTGFEPVISALKERRPSPLDERGPLTAARQRLVKR